LDGGSAWYFLNKGFLCNGKFFEDDTLDPGNLYTATEMTFCLVDHLQPGRLHAHGPFVFPPCLTHVLPVGPNQSITATLDQGRARLTIRSNNITLGVINGVVGADLRFFCMYSAPTIAGLINFLLYIFILCADGTPLTLC
jgi:hypothetical protein